MHTWLISCSRFSPLSLNSIVARNCWFCYHIKKRKQEQVKIVILFNNLFWYVSYPSFLYTSNKKPSTSKHGTSTKGGSETKF